LSIASPSCRIEWRPSRQLCLALLALGLLAALAAWLSDLPPGARFLLALASPAYGAWLARREWRRPPCVLELDREAVVMHGSCRSAELSAPRLRLRGPLASVEARGADGRRQVLLWSADTLPAHSRRQLRLRLGGQSAA
jgi:toxin CptA